jgi:LytR cell envelope-related transcriptional attenuator
MSDVPRRSSRPGTPPPRAASPVIAVVVTLVAAVLGFFILKSLDGDDGGAGASNPGTETTATTLAAQTTLTAPPTTMNRSSFQVLVANASGVKGSAATMTTELEGAGFSLLPASNAVPGYGPRDVTDVFYLPGFEAEGAEVALVLGVTAQPMPSIQPVTDTDFAGAVVLVALGTDMAGRTLAEISSGVTTTDSSVAPVDSIAGSPNDSTTTTAG